LSTGCQLPQGFERRAQLRETPFSCSRQIETDEQYVVVASTNALSAYAVEFPGLESRKSAKDRWHERLEMHHAVGRRTDEQHADGQCGQVLLELDTPVHRDQRVVLACHSPKKFTVRDASPSTARHRIDTVAFERRGRIYGELLVKKNAHQPAA
jgi:hypothetical protein